MYPPFSSILEHLISTATNESEKLMLLLTSSKYYFLPIILILYQAYGSGVFSWRAREEIFGGTCFVGYNAFFMVKSLS